MGTFAQSSGGVAKQHPIAARKVAFSPPKLGEPERLKGAARFATPFYSDLSKTRAALLFVRSSAHLQAIAKADLCTRVHKIRRCAKRPLERTNFPAFSCFALASLPFSRASFELHYSEMLRFSRLCHGFGGGYFLSVLTGLVITSRARTLTFPNNSPVPLRCGLSLLSVVKLYSPRGSGALRGSCALFRGCAEIAIELAVLTHH